jgi:hypothetical protein
MPNLVTFDDGETYVPLSDIESFGHDDEETNKGGTWIKLKNGRVIKKQWKVSEIA